MSARAGFGRIFAAALLACLIGLLTFDTMSVVWDGATSGFYVGQIGIFFGVLLAGGFFALFTAVPLGCAVAWLVSRSGPPSLTRAAVAGAFTGAIWPVLFREMISRPEFDLQLIEFSGAFAVMGSISGWIAYRVVFGGSNVAFDAG